MKRTALWAVLVLASCSSGKAPAPPPPAPDRLADLSPSLEALRSEFNAHAQEARFLTLLSPT